GRHSGHRAGRNHIAGAVAHRRVMGENLRDFYRHLAGMRSLPRFAVDAQLHCQIMRVRNLVGSNDPRSQGTKRIDALAETEYSGLHFAALDVASSDVVE